MNLRIISTVLFVMAVMGLVGNSNDGSLESRIAYVISALCGFGAVIIEIYLWRKKK